MAEEEGAPEKLPFTGLVPIDGRRKHILYADRAYEQVSVSHQKMSDFQKQGYTQHKLLKTRVQMRRPKPHGAYWNHQVWSVFAKMNFKHVNNILSGEPRLNLDGLHEIDVFAYDEGTAIVVECKSKKSEGSQSIKKYLHEIEGYRKKAEKIIKSKYGKLTEVAWCVATSNYVINKKDKALARESEISLLTKPQIEYFLKLFKGTKQVSRYQLLAYLFEDRRIQSLASTVPAIKTKIGPHQAYIFATYPGKLLPISYISHRGNQDEDDVNAFQRLVKGARLKEIRKFIENSDGFFPNSILLNIDSRDEGAKFLAITESDGVSFGVLKLPGMYKTAWIIDGQHRLLAFAETPKKDTLLIPVIAFYDLPQSDQADMFVTINNKQRKVPQNVIIELNASLKWGSPKPEEMIEAMHARTMLLLNSKAGSPLKGLIRLTGEAPKGRPFTTNTIVTALRRMSPYGKIEKNSLVHGSYWRFDNDHNKAMENSCIVLYEIISEYLQIFKDGCDNWDTDLGKQEGGFILTNNAISALIHVMYDLISEHEKQHNVLSRDYEPEDIVEWIKPQAQSIVEFINECDIPKLQELRSKYGLAGQTELKIIIEGEIQRKHSDFNPKGLQRELKKIDSAWKDKTAKLVKEMEETITENIISLLKQHYGQSDSEWFSDGVPAQVQFSARKIQIENKSSLEGSFQILNFHSIVQFPKNYSIFQPIYSIKNYPEKGNSSKSQSLSWFNVLNELRKKSLAHAYGKTVLEEDYTKLRQLWDILLPRIDKSNTQIEDASI